MAGSPDRPATGGTQRIYFLSRAQASHEPIIESCDDKAIEMAFLKLKALLGNPAKRTVEGLWSVIGRLIDAVTPNM